MNWKRFVTALLVVSVVVTAFDVLYNAKLFAGVFERSAGFLLPADQLNARVALGWLAMFGMYGFLGLIFVRGARHGAGRGLEFGLWLGLASAAGTLGLVSIVPWPRELVLTMALQQFANSLLVGLLFGLIYRPKAAVA